MADPVSKSPTIDSPRPNESPPTAPQPLWRIAWWLMLLLAPAVFFHYRALSEHFAAEALQWFVAGAAIAEIMFVLALAAWSPSPIGVRIIHASGLLIVLSAAVVLGEYLWLPGPHWTIAAARMTMTAASYLATAVPLVVLRCISGWRFTPSAAERRLSILDLLCVTALVAAALAVGGLAENLWDVTQAGARITALAHACSLAVLVTGVAGLCFRVRWFAAVPLIAFPAALSAAALYLPYVRFDDDITSNLSAIYMSVAPTMFVSAYLLAGLCWLLKRRGVSLTLGR